MLLVEIMLLVLVVGLVEEDGGIVLLVLTDEDVTVIPSHLPQAGWQPLDTRQ